MALELVVTRTTFDQIRTDVEADWAAEAPNPVSPTNVKAVSITRDPLDSESVIVVTAFDALVA